MKPRTKKLLIVGGAAAGAYWLYSRSRKAPVAVKSGLAGLSGAEEDAWLSSYNRAKGLYDKQVAAIEPLPEKPKGVYASQLYLGGGSIFSQLKSSFDLGNQGAYVPAKNAADAAIKGLSRLEALIAADLQDPSQKTSWAIGGQRLKDIAAAQAANEADRLLAEQGALAWLATKGGESLGKGAAGVAGGLSKGAWAFLKQLPWWVYVLGLGGAAVYLGAHTMLIRKATSLAGLGAAPAKTNPRRRRK